MDILELKTIYLDKIKEALDRLNACESFFELYRDTQSVFAFEAAVLQMRKALECVAYAAIAPNKKEYAAFRANADKQTDYTKDYHARQILTFLSKINSDFFPMPVSAPVKIETGEWHFAKREDESLTKKEFESFYDRLGKFLHADNPWGHDKGVKNLIGDMPKIINSTRLLLSWHFIAIRTPAFIGVWVIEAPANGAQPKVVVGQADGDFVINNNVDIKSR